MSKPVLCRVCGDKASGKHYGVTSCDGCRGFFKRSIRRSLDYVCKENGTCVIDVTRRNQCQACRFKKCLEMNMRKEAVQHERSSKSYSRRPPHGQEVLGKGVFPFYSLTPHQLPLAVHSNYVPNTLNPLSSLGLNSLLTKRRGCHLVDGVQQPQHPVNQKEEVTSTSGGEAPQARTTKFKEEDRFGWKVSFNDDHRSGEFPKHCASDIPGQTKVLTSAPIVSENMYESSAKLLFHCVTWARSIPAFLQLPFRDQAILLEETWSELFVISAAQWKLPVEKNELFANRGVSSEDVAALSEIISRFDAFRPDDIEYSFLKSIVLLNPEAKGLRDVAQVSFLQEQSLLMLHDYSFGMCPCGGKIRFGRLLLLLPSIHRFRARTVEELFFRKTVGNIPIERLLCEMFKSS